MKLNNFQSAVHNTFFNYKIEYLKQILGALGLFVFFFTEQVGFMNFGEGLLIFKKYLMFFLRRSYNHNYDVFILKRWR